MMAIEEDRRSSKYRPSRISTVLLMDDHPVVALGIKLAFRECASLALLGVTLNPAEASGAIAAHLPDALVLDLVFSGAVHLSLIRESRLALPHAVIVVFTSLPPRLYKTEALAAGADAYLTKDNDLAALVSVLTDLCAKRDEGDSPNPAKPAIGPIPIGLEPTAPKVRLALGDGVHLTRREQEIAELMGQGLSIGQIAPLLGASQNTIAVHRDNLRQKLGCRDSRELIVLLARLYAGQRSGG